MMCKQFERERENKRKLFTDFKETVGLEYGV